MAKNNPFISASSVGDRKVIVPDSATDDITYDDVASTYDGPLTELREEDRRGALCGAQILAKSLQSEGVDVLFGYPIC